MTMLCLVLSLSTSHLFLMTPSVIGKEHFQGTEGRPLSKMKTTVSETTIPETPPSLLLLIKRNKIMKERNTPVGEVSSPRSSQAKSPDAQTDVKIRGSMTGTNGDIPPEMPEIEGDACRKVDLIINAAYLGLPPKLTKPESFNAYQCKGKLSLTQGKMFVNHSLMKLLVKKENGIKTDGEACCVPTKLRPMSFIYYVKERESFVMHTFQDMIVEKCGCY